MNVTYRCPRCEATVKNDVSHVSDAIECAQCGVRLDIPETSITENSLSRCLVCPSQELYVRKDFPQGLGVAIVVAGFAVSTWTWYRGEVIATFAVLFASALADLLLYWLMPDHLVCYHCGAQYRGVEQMDEHGAFNLETHERHRQLAARMAQTRLAARPSQSSADRAS